MDQYPRRNQCLAAKVETTSGTDAAPTVAANAIRVESGAVTPNLEVVTINEWTGSYDDTADLPAGGYATFNGVAVLRGSGTPETPPEWAPLLKSCGFDEQVTSVAVTGTAQAGSTSQVTLAAGASAVDDFYTGMPITITGGSGVGQTAFITQYTGSTKIAKLSPTLTTALDATSLYSIPKNVRYKPASTALASVTIYHYMHRADGGLSRLRKLLGGVGTFQLQLPVRGAARMTFRHVGKFTSPSDATYPGAPTYMTTLAQPFLAATLALGGTTIRTSEIRLDMGADIQVGDDPSATMGYDLGYMNSRRFTGRVNPPKELLSVRDAIGSWLAQTLTTLVWTWGSTTGNKLAFVIPQLHYSPPEDEEVKGMMHDGLGFQALSTFNNAIAICQY